MTPLLRPLPWPALLLVTALATVLVGRFSDVVGLRVALVLVAASAALVCDNPAEVLLDASPTTRLLRRGARWLAGVAWAYAVWLGLLALVPDAPTRALAGELAVLLALSLAAGSFVGGASAGPVLLAVVVTGLRLSIYVSHVREIGFALGLAGLALAARDPATQGNGR